MINNENTQNYLQAFGFKTSFIEEFGWNKLNKKMKFLLIPNLSFLLANQLLNYRLL
jgi:hypothetical protein